MTIDERKRQIALARRGIASRNADAKAVYKQTKDPKAAIRAYCAGNKWAIENAKAVGNWE